MKLLVVEDEIDLLEVIRQSLEKENYLVETAGSYVLALEKIVSYEYDCILLDIMLPDGTGLDLLAELKQMNKSDNVIIISAKDSLEDKIKGLEMGADDYLVKPFHIAELNARIKSVLRRKSLNGKNTIEHANVKIDLDERQVWIDGDELVLNRKEFDILSYLAVNKNRLVNKTALAEQVWGDYMDGADDYEFIYSQIKNLRKKLKEKLAGIEVQAVYGIGYKLVVA
ncbi:DNA-binding response regulator, OmpR family, contains REC and winged-helix (wHTH) domain [Pedobacter steynii]|uniref:DNA-binding response regulator, OmpR family, contains REC and winged-helix (WHTH) domain n=1 Tax=Pedobacter steynii TaxID=430522 RepID=A0A1H0B3V6_9SPHI|nr:response regulator transcription factor [Pedobacter steynii]NQX41167.1 response regulator transcription factor [Pedobacter steynii]SDN40360.1 DNA-binding response regulator, OmpR family, contains REC and winged-helix (wHTH) domain [Pedobacter steynii]